MKTIAAAIAAMALTACVASAGNSPANVERCALTRSDLVANRLLSWPDFDQQGTARTSWRSLAVANCHSAAAMAYADYLAFGPPIKSERFQTTARFHLGQSLANAGRTEEAARMMATARREIEVGGLHWNDYVQGNVAFLTRDRDTLVAKQIALAAQPGVSDRINARVLAGLLQCWDRPYLEAASATCLPVSDSKSPSE